MSDNSTFDGEDDILALSDDELDALGDGITLDAKQTGEIQSIFLTALPQYLEPVAEMLEQLLSDPTDSETRSALVATLSSLVTAAERIGVETATLRLDRMRKSASELDESTSDDLGEQLQWDLEALRELSNDGDADSAERAVTLVSVLRGRLDVDEGVLGKLTAAGIVTVDQFETGRDDEIAAVTGLDLSAVQGLREIVSAASAQSSRSENVVELDLGDTALDRQLANKLQTQVDREVARDEVAAEVQRLRRDTNDLRDHLDAGARSLEQLREQLADTQASLRAGAAALKKLISARDALLSRRDEAESLVNQREKVILDLRRQQTATERQQARFGEEVAKLMRRMARVLEHAQQGGHAWWVSEPDTKSWRR